MAYRVDIFSSGNTPGVGWWHTFCKATNCNGLTGLDAALVKFRAKDVPGTPFIEFESEEDFTMFLLQFA